MKSNVFVVCLLASLVGSNANSCGDADAFNFIATINTLLLQLKWDVEDTRDYNAKIFEKMRCYTEQTIEEFSVFIKENREDIVYLQTRVLELHTGLEQLRNDLEALTGRRTTLAEDKAQIYNAHLNETMIYNAEMTSLKKTLIVLRDFAVKFFPQTPASFVQTDAHQEWNKVWQAVGELPAHSQLTKEHLVGLRNAERAILVQKADDPRLSDIAKATFDVIIKYLEGNRQFLRQSNAINYHNYAGLWTAVATWESMLSEGAKTKMAYITEIKIMLADAWHHWNFIIEQLRQDKVFYTATWYQGNTWVDHYTVRANQSEHEHDVVSTTIGLLNSEEFQKEFFAQNCSRCCKANVAKCHACEEQLSIADFCKVEKNKMTYGCPGYECCAKTMASCISCTTGTPIADLCGNAGHLVAGCMNYNGNYFGLMSTKEQAPALWQGDVYSPGAGAGPTGEATWEQSRDATEAALNSIEKDESMCGEMTADNGQHLVSIAYYHSSYSETAGKYKSIGASCEAIAMNMNRFNLLFKLDAQRQPIVDASGEAAIDYKDGYTWQTVTGPVKCTDIDWKQGDITCEMAAVATNPDGTQIALADKKKWKGISQGVEDVLAEETCCFAGGGNVEDTSGKDLEKGCAIRMPTNEALTVEGKVGSTPGAWFAACKQTCWEDEHHKQDAWFNKILAAGKNTCQGATTPGCATLFEDNPKGMKNQDDEVLRMDKTHDEEGYCTGAACKRILFERHCRAFVGSSYSVQGGGYWKSADKEDKAGAITPDYESREDCLSSIPTQIAFKFTNCMVPSTWIGGFSAGDSTGKIRDSLKEESLFAQRAHLQQCTARENRGKMSAAVYSWALMDGLGEGKMQVVLQAWLSEPIPTDPIACDAITGVIPEENISNAFDCYQSVAPGSPVSETLTIFQKWKVFCKGQPAVESFLQVESRDNSASTMAMQAKKAFMALKTAAGHTKSLRLAELAEQLSNPTWYESDGYFGEFAQVLDKIQHLMTILEEEQATDDSDYAECLKVTTEYDEASENYEHTRKKYQLQKAQAEQHQAELEAERSALNAKIVYLQGVKSDQNKAKQSAQQVCDGCKGLNNNRITLLDRAINMCVAYLEDQKYLDTYGTAKLARKISLSLAQKKQECDEFTTKEACPNDGEAARCQWNGDEATGNCGYLTDAPKIERIHRTNGTTDYSLENFDAWNITHPQTTSIVQMFQLMVDDANADNVACEREKDYAHKTADDEIAAANAEIAASEAEIASITAQIGDTETPGTTADLIAVATAEIALVNSRIASLNTNHVARAKYCTWLTGNYKDRRTLRNGERDALSHAWAFLKGRQDSTKPIFEVKDAAAKPFKV